jgi:hypothetical protein
MILFTPANVANGTYKIMVKKRRIGENFRIFRDFLI